MRPFLLTAGLALFAFGAPVGAAPRSGAPTIKKLPQLQAFELANGLRVAVLETDAAPVASVQLWVRAGSKDEPRNRRGVSSLVEHLMSSGSQHVRAGGHGALLASIGGETGSYSYEDAAVYVDVVPSEQVDFAMKLEAERLRGLLLLPEQIAAEREVVKDAARQAQTNPLTAGFLRVLAATFTKHPYAWTATGNVADIEAITDADVKAFYDAYYQPNNAMLVVVGKVTLADVKRLAETHFGPLAKGAVPARETIVEPAATAAKKEVAEPGNYGFALVGFRIPAAADADAPAVQLAAIVLGGGESSRLKSLLKAKPSAVRDVGLQVFSRQEPGLAVAWGLYPDPAGGDAAVAAVTDAAKLLATKGVTAQELRKAKNQVQSAFVFSLENVEGLADAIGRSWISYGDPAAFLKEVERVEAVTEADIKRVAAKYLTPDRATIVVVPPQGGAK